MAKIPVKIVVPNSATAGSGGMVDAKFFNNKLAEVKEDDGDSHQPLPMTQDEFDKLV